MRSNPTRSCSSTRVAASDSVEAVGSQVPFDPSVSTTMTIFDPASAHFASVAVEM